VLQRQLLALNAFRSVTRGDVLALARFSCSGRSAQHGAQDVEGERRQRKRLRRVVQSPDDRFVGLFRRSTVIACGYHRSEPALGQKSGCPAR